jgi:hypothetical protein
LIYDLTCLECEIWHTNLEADGFQVCPNCEYTACDDCFAEHLRENRKCRKIWESEQ